LSHRLVLSHIWNINQIHTTLTTGFGFKYANYKATVWDGTTMLPIHVLTTTNICLATTKQTIGWMARRKRTPDKLG
jgi:hypothetical protein